jgi:hypothetical protein
MPRFNEHGILVASIPAPSSQRKSRSDGNQPKSWMSALVGTAVVLTCLMVLGIVVGVAWPSIQAGIRRVAQARDLDNMRTIAKALNAYCDRYGSYPPPATVNAQGKKLLSWRVLILPFMGYEDLYKRFELSQPWDSPSNMNLLRDMPTEYASPNSPDALTTFEANYALIVGTGTIFPASGPLARQDVEDGTILLVETQNNAAWTSPGDLDVNSGLRVGSQAMKDIGGLHKQSFTAVTVDEEGLRIPLEVSSSVLDAMISPSGGENVDTKSFQK